MDQVVSPAPELGVSRSKVESRRWPLRSRSVWNYRPSPACESLSTIRPVLGRGRHGVGLAIQMTRRIGTPSFLPKPRNGGHIQDLPKIDFIDDRHSLAASVARLFRLTAYISRD